MKKYLLNILCIYFVFITKIYANWPTVVCTWLPGCSWWNNAQITWKWFFWFIGRVITEMINYIAVISVISLMIAWVMYVLSAWEDEQVKKAKKWITWALIWVFISTSAWAIINLANSLRIN